VADIRTQRSSVIFLAENTQKRAFQLRRAIIEPNAQIFQPIYPPPNPPLQGWGDVVLGSLTKLSKQLAKLALLRRVCL
jgi:hypothetical protein